MSRYAKHYENESSVCVFDTDEADGVTLYKIRVCVGSVSWTVSHRYRDFDELHSKLSSERGVARDLLPPKRAIRNKCPKFIERRRELLDEYLRAVFDFLRLTIPREFAAFLDLHKYDVLFLLQDMAAELFANGDALLLKSTYYELQPLQLYAISERLKEPRSFFELADRRYDFGHVLDFCSRLERLSIKGSDENIESSNIRPNSLPFDMTPFKSLMDLFIAELPMRLITDAGTLRNTLRRLRVHETNAVRIADILLCDVPHKEATTDEQKFFWKEVEEVDFSRNEIVVIDESIKLLPKLRKLTLNGNKISEISNLSSLPRLSHLNLSRNTFEICEDWHSKIGKITSINLSENSISSLAGFVKLYSLESLDLSCNRISDVEEVQHVCKLPCLENLRLTANPVASVVDYRVKVIEQFDSRMHDICLDNEKASEKEIDTARILQALRIAKEGKAPTFFSHNEHGFSTLTAEGGCGL